MSYLACSKIIDYKHQIKQKWNYCNTVDPKYESSQLVQRNTIIDGIKGSEKTEQQGGLEMRATQA